MNPHLHRHLYSDLPGYKLGRSSGILSRGFHGKLWLLKLLSTPSPFFPHPVSICGGRWSLRTSCLLRSVLAPSSFSMWCQLQVEGENPVAGIPFEGTIWRVTGALTLEVRDMRGGVFKQRKLWENYHYGGLRDDFSGMFKIHKSHKSSLLFCKASKGCSGVKVILY